MNKAQTARRARRCRPPRRSRPTIPGVRALSAPRAPVPGIWFRRQHQARFRLRLAMLDGRETGLCAGRSLRAVRRARLVAIPPTALSLAPSKLGEGASESANVGTVGDEGATAGESWYRKKTPSERLQWYTWNQQEIPMSSKNASSKIVSVDEQTFEQTDEQWVDEDGFEVVDETPELRATVEMEIQAKVDLNHPDGVVDTSDDRIDGATLEQEERIRAREAELASISAKAKLGEQVGREKRTRDAAAEGSRTRRATFQKRATSVDPLADPDRPDPREELTREELGAVNTETSRVAEKLNGWSRAAISRRLAERVVDGADMLGAVVGVYEELRTGPGQVIPIADVSEVNRKEVSISGEVVQLWTPSHSRIAQVGLIEDETGTIKFTAWKASGVPAVREGEQVTFRSVAKNWYEGRYSVALTGWSDVLFDERSRSE